MVGKIPGDFTIIRWAERIRKQSVRITPQEISSAKVQAALEENTPKECIKGRTTSVILSRWKEGDPLNG